VVAETVVRARSTDCRDGKRLHIQQELLLLKSSERIHTSSVKELYPSGLIRGNFHEIGG